MSRQIISINSILLSDENPRLDPALGEDEAIRNMILNQKSRILILASDIVDKGLNPLEIIGVYPSEKYEGFYEVGEGNRRVCAIKLLINPKRIYDIDLNLYNSFINLSKNFKLIDSLEVEVFESEKDISHWMEIRHMGEQGGKGLSKWNSVQKARFKKKQTGSEELLDFWEWMIEKNILSKEEIYSVTKTNWQRILRQKYFPFLKIEYDRAYSVLPHNIEKFKERIRKIQQELSGKSVSIVYDKSKIEDFFNLISKSLYGKSYDEIIIEESRQITIFTTEQTNSVCTEKVDLEKQIIEECIGGTEENQASNMIDFQQSGYSNFQLNRDVFSGCNSIIPLQYIISSNNMRLNKIIYELKHLDVSKYPNACGTLLRTLFELSAKVYLEKIDGSNCTELLFEKVIKRAANELRNRNRIDNSQHSAIIKDIDNLRLIFNGYMHNTECYPSSEALKNFFKSHRIFIQECLK